MAMVGILMIEQQGLHFLRWIASELERTLQEVVAIEDRVRVHAAEEVVVLRLGETWCCLEEHDHTADWPSAAVSISKRTGKFD
jgi:hypothetical protein